MSETLKDVNHYLRLPYRVEIYPEPDGSGYTAEIPDLPGCLTCADTLDELFEMIEDAKRLWLQVALEDDDPIPEPSPVEAEFILVPGELHHRLVERARQEGRTIEQLVRQTLSAAIEPV